MSWLFLILILPGKMKSRNIFCFAPKTVIPGIGQIYTTNELSDWDG